MKGDNCGDRSIITFVYLYSIGGFIKRHLEHIQIKNFKVHNIIKNLKYWQLYICISVIFFVLVTYLPNPYGKAINGLSNEYNSIGLTIFSIIFFCAFKNIKLQNSFINYIAKSSFAIYLIHGHNIVTYHRWIYNPFTEYGLHIEGGCIRLLYLFGAGLTIVVSCIIIDQFRMILFNYLGINSLIRTIDKRINNIITI